MATEQKQKKRTKPDWDGSPLGNPAEAAKRRERVIANYRARRAELPTSSQSPAEILQEFGQQVFGSPEGEQVLIDWLREHSAWFDDEELEDGEAIPPSPNGR